MTETARHHHLCWIRTDNRRQIVPKPQREEEEVIVPVDTGYNDNDDAMDGYMYEYEYTAGYIQEIYEVWTRTAAVEYRVYFMVCTCMDVYPPYNFQTHKKNTS